MRIAVDTSVAVPYLMTAHVAHDAVRGFLDADEPVLTQHSLAETYSVLTRLPGDARVAPLDAARLIDANFTDVLTLDPTVATAVHRELSRLDIAGGGVYDALIALAAHSAGTPLATRDQRAADTYQSLGVDVRLVTGPDS